MFKVIVLTLCKLLKVTYRAVAPENHWLVRIKFFSLYLKKAKILHWVDTQILSKWLLRAQLAIYAHNESLINGKDIIHSFAP